ncbi:MAG TPA: cytochrome c oxidase assembly factor Coa1 family protein [Pyrinomonadaceae bacterium]|nr:cytochrome c oxidase assembly factor Coa1 family protein [Pyrinomonadaceae bacterium]
MTTKKLVVIVLSAMVGLFLAFLLFVGGVVGIAFYSVANSDAAVTAKEFLRGNEKLKHDIGEVKDFGYFVTGEIKTEGGGGRARLHLKVIGERRTVNASVRLEYRDSGAWRVREASYQNESGVTVELVEDSQTNKVTATRWTPNAKRGGG